MKAGWKTVKLSDVTELLADGDWIESKDQSDDGIRLIQTGNIGDGTFKDREEKARYISESTFKRLRCTEIFEGDCLVSRLPEPVGRSCILPSIPRSITAVDCSIIRFKQSLILPEYFCYFSQSRNYQILVESKTSGTTRKRISRSHLSEIEIPLPPLAEQKRIVALLDEAFAGIDEAKAKAENTMKGYDVLSRGITDRLVFPVDAIHPIKALGQVVEIARGGSPRPIQNYFTDAPDGINWIKISDATASGKYIYKTVQKIKPSGLKKTRMVKPGDFLLSNSMSFGRPYIMKTSGCIHDGWLVLSGVERELDQDYLYHVLGSNSVYAQFDRLAAGSTVRNLNSESASKVLIPVPPISLQKEIAGKLDHAQEVIAAAQQLTSKKHEALISLRASILSQAFAGELTA
jgi:type I restriction enzyme, S subunit